MVWSWRINQMYLSRREKEKIKELTGLEIAVLFYINSSTEFPLTIIQICNSLSIRRSVFSKLLNSLVTLDLVDVIEYPTHKEIFKKGYLEVELNEI